MQHTLRRLIKGLAYVALGCYVFLAVAVLGVRHWVLPNIDQWREPLQRELSVLLPGQVQLGQIQAEWRGRHPRVRLRDAAVFDDDGRLLLNIPSVDAVLAWSSVFSGSPRFLSLQADGVELTLRRDLQNRISLVGYEVGAGESDKNTDTGDTSVLNWLSRQNHVSFSRARITWLDDLRGAPPLQMHDVTLNLGMQGDQHFFSVVAKPPAALGESFTLQGRVEAGATDQPLRPEEINGLLHVNVEDMRPAAWQPWLDAESILEEGRVSWRGWQVVEKGEPRRHVSQLKVENAVWQAAQGIGLQAASAQLYLAGEWEALRQLTAKNVLHTGSDTREMRVAAQIQGLTLEAADTFEAPLFFDEIATAADVSQDTQAGLRLAFETLQLRNADMDLALNGNWQEKGSGSAGLVNMQGRFARAELAAIVRYLPAIVNDDARSWLRHGLLAGRIVDAPLRLQGDLARFPFGDDPAQGDFIVGGKVENAVIDYAPAATVGPPGWPRLESLNGHAQLHRVDLTIHADTMQMLPGGHPIELRDVDARIPNIDHDSILDVAGTGRGQADAFLSLLKESPLSRMLDSLFDQASGAGEWEVPIALTIPLMDVDESTVKGGVVFKQGALQLDAVYPALSKLEGRLSFSEEAVTADGLKAQVLGGPATISGGLGKGQKGLVFNGKLRAQALDEFLEGRLNGVLKGDTAYRLALLRNPAGEFGMQLDSKLEGMSINLPAPLTKSAKQPSALTARWVPGGKGADLLDISLAGGLAAKFLHRNGRNGGPYFYAGALNLHGKVEPPPEGLALDIQTPQIDLDAWRSLAETTGGQGGEASEAGIFPPLRDLRLKADKATVFGSELDQLTFTARQPEGERWRVDVTSTQTAGTLFWRERRGRIEGDIDAHFQRLALGEAHDNGAENKAKQEKTDEDALNLADDIDFPAIRLKVDKLQVYGRHLGALSLVGLNEARGRRWKLEQLEVASQHASFKGSGIWQLDGPQRGLTLQAHAMFDDLGAYLEQAGFKDLMHGGHGQVQGVIEWRDLPWKLESSGLQGELNIDLAKGRFASVGSRSARLLELLSLQSVQRLASLSWNPSGLMQQGFPFDTLQGRIKMEDGVLHSENYRLTGPVATIVMAGDVDLPKENLDLYAVVIPNLDVSGAAIAAGIAVNPIVGVGAFLTQWLLKAPMSKAMTVEYRVKGDFESPAIEVVDTPQ